jgi:hypothetical protein
MDFEYGPLTTNYTDKSAAQLRKSNEIVAISASYLNSSVNNASASTLLPLETCGVSSRTENSRGPSYWSCSHCFLKASRPLENPEMSITKRQREAVSNRPSCGAEMPISVSKSDFPMRWMPPVSHARITCAHVARIAYPCSWDGECMRRFVLFAALILYVCALPATAAERYGEWLLERPSDLNSRSVVQTIHYVQQ